VTVNPVFITGGTGYLGRPPITALLEWGFVVHALARPQSVRRLPSGAIHVIGNALDDTTFAATIPPRATFVHHEYPCIRPPGQLLLIAATLDRRDRR
jgi:nucleoside-diphosphate-sugar epimerase